MASNDARGMDGRRLSSNEEDYVQEGDSSDDFGGHYRGDAIISPHQPALSQKTTPLEPPPQVVRTSIGIIGEAFYPPLDIVEIPSELEGVRGGGINLKFFMIPTTFNETFNSRWQAQDLSHGRVNPVYNYGGTQREVSLSFTLAAFTVQEAKSNLIICGDLARTVYGRYRLSSRGNSSFAGYKEFTIDFGSLIRDERCVINNFSFTANPDSGVFDYSDGEDTDVTHSSRGVVLPREVNVEIAFIVVHDYLLGFGGQNRPGEPLRWAENRSRDYPHGTGPIPVQLYMSPTTEALESSLPRVVHPRDDDFDSPPAGNESAIDIADDAINDAIEGAALIESAASGMIPA